MLLRLGNAVAPAIDLGYHCCYGNFNLKHFVEPIDMGDMVDVVNKVTSALERPVQFIHMPVPIDRSDDAYFAPLRDLKRGQRPGILPRVGPRTGRTRRHASACTGRSQSHIGFRDLD